MVIVVANTKGGVGKSTLSMHFLHAMLLQGEGKKVMLFDADPQATCISWSRLRADRELTYMEVQALSSQGMKAILEQKRTEYDIILIDVGGSDNKNLRAAIMLADAVVVPTSLDPAEREHTFDMIDLVAECLNFNDRLQCMIVLNNVHATKEREALADFKKGFAPFVQWIDHFVMHRVVLSRVYSQGRTVFDIEERPTITSSAAKSEALSAAKARADIAVVLKQVLGYLDTDIGVLRVRR